MPNDISEKMGGPIPPKNLKAPKFLWRGYRIKTLGAGTEDRLRCSLL